MGNYRKLLAIVLIGGVLLGGLGTGIALAEYASLEYAGERRLPLSNPVTQEFTLDIPADCTASDPFYVDIYYSNYGSGNRLTVIEDGSVALGTLTLQVTYDQDMVIPVLSLDEESNVAALYWDHHDPGELSQFLALKDQILADLKERKIGNYTAGYMENPTILIHPQDRARIAH